MRSVVIALLSLSAVTVHAQQLHIPIRKDPSRNVGLSKDTISIVRIVHDTVRVHDTTRVVQKDTVTVTQKDTVKESCCPWIIPIPLFFSRIKSSSTTSSDTVALPIVWVLPRPPRPPFFPPIDTVYIPWTPSAPLDTVYIHLPPSSVVDTLRIYSFTTDTIYKSFPPHHHPYPPDHPPITATPEPGSFVLFGSGLAMLGIVYKRRKK